MSVVSIHSLQGAIQGKHKRFTISAINSYTGLHEATHDVPYKNKLSKHDKQIVDKVQVLHLAVSMSHLKHIPLYKSRVSDDDNT